MRNYNYKVKSSGSIYIALLFLISLFCFSNDFYIYKVFGSLVLILCSIKSINFTLFILLLSNIIFIDEFQVLGIQTQYLITFILLVHLLSRVNFKNSIRLPLFLSFTFFLFVLILLVDSLHTPFVSLGIIKVIKFTGLNGVIMLSIVFLINEHKQIKSFFNDFAIFGLAYLSFSLVYYFTDFAEMTYNRFNVLDANPNLLARFYAIFALIMILKGIKNKVYLIFGGISFFLLLMTASKSSLLGFLLILIILLLVFYRRYFIIIISILYITVLLFLSRAPEIVLKTINVFESGSLDSRMSFVNIALNDQINYFFGAGTMSFQQKYGAYPHNLFVEIFYENGVLGLIIIILLIGSSVYIIIKYIIFDKKDIYIWMVFGVFFIGLVSSQFSEDITGNRFLFLSIAIIHTLSKNEDKKFICPEKILVKND